MGYREKEQTEFLGLFTNELGTGAPQLSTADCINVDYTKGTARGRAAAKTIFSTPISGQGIAFDGRYRYALADNTASVFSLSSMTAFTMRVYFRLSDYFKFRNAIFVGALLKQTIASSAGDSTDVESSGLTGGWSIVLHSGVFSTKGALIISWWDGSAVQELTFNAGHTFEDKDYCIEWKWSGTSYTMSLYEDGGTSPVRTEDAAVSSSASPEADGTHHFNIGAFRAGADSSRQFFFDGAIGSVEVWNSSSPADNPWIAKNRSSLPAGLDYLVQWDEGEGYESEPLGVDAWTNTAAAKIEIHPRPPTVAETGETSGVGYPGNKQEILFTKLSHGYLDIAGVDVAGASTWGFTMGVYVPGPGEDWATPGQPAFLLSSEFDDVRITINDGTAPATQYKLVISVKTFAADGSGFSTCVVTTTDLTYGTHYKLAVQLVMYYATVKSDLHVSTALLGEAWSLGDDMISDLAVNGLATKAGTILRFNAGPGFGEYVNFGLAYFNFYMNKTAATASSSFVYDEISLKGSSVTGQLIRLVTSWADSIETSDTIDGISRALELNCSGPCGVKLRVLPSGGPVHWAAVGSMTSGVKPKIQGVFPALTPVADGGAKREVICHIGNGVYVYNRETDVGKFYRNDAGAGVPRSGTRGLEYKERVILFGDGISPMKFSRDKLGVVGLPIPYYQATLVSGDGNGALADSSTYYYRMSVYNSATGQESNLGLERRGDTDANHEFLTITVSNFHVEGTEDWDFIRLWRRLGLSGQYYLDQAIARHKINPPVGPDLVVISSKSDTQINLEISPAIDNDRPPEFTAAAIVGDRMMYTGGGPNPGMVGYTKFGLIESAPPSNLWTLNVDNGDRGMAIFEISARVVILKQGSVWAANADAADYGQKPRQIHETGCVGVGASVATKTNLFFVGTDRAVYASDGAAVIDISSAVIKSTLESYTVGQLADVQAGHDPAGKTIWFQIDNQALVYSYGLNMWQIYETPVDCLASGHKDKSERNLLWGFRGQVYYPDHSDSTGVESDLGTLPGSGATFAINYDGGATDLKEGPDGDVWALENSGETLNADLAGLPIIVVVHTTAYQPDPAVASYYSPIREGTISYNHIAGVDGATILLGEGVDANPATDEITIYIKTQRRRHRSQRIGPQGEGYGYRFGGMTFVTSEELTAGTRGAEAFFRLDKNTPWLFAKATGTVDEEDSFATVGRGRALQWEYWAFGPEEMELQRAIMRYRVRGPRRRK